MSISLSLRCMYPASLLLALLFIPSDVAARAGGGENYSSGSGSSSSSREHSFSTYERRSVTPSRPPSSNSSSSSSSTKPSAGSEKYALTYGINSFSSEIKINRDGTVDVAEFFDVQMPYEQYGITNEVNTEVLYNSLLISDVSCDRGYASWYLGKFEFGYKDRRVSGRQSFTLRYRAAGAVVPGLNGATFKWRSILSQRATYGTISVILPPGASASAVRGLSIEDTWKYFQAWKNIPYAVRGNRIVFWPSTADPADISITIPGEAVDIESVRKNAMLAVDKKHLPALESFASKAVLNADRTIDREDIYVFSPDNTAYSTQMKYLSDFRTWYYAGDGGDAQRVPVCNTLYLYGFTKPMCGYDDYTPWSVRIPSAKGSVSVKYSTWGNFNPGEPFFVDLLFPPAGVSRTGSTRFEIGVPAFAAKEKVRPRFYLMRMHYDLEMMLHEIPASCTWEGNTLVGEYPAGLYNGQYLLARIYLPSDGFGSPGILKKAYIRLSSSLTFNTWPTLALIAAPLLLLAGLILAVLLRRRFSAQRAAAPVIVSADPAAIGVIAADDPAFSADLFLQRVQLIASKIQSAWSDGDMGEVRNFVSQGIYTRFRIQLRLMREYERLINVTGGFRVVRAAVIGASVSGPYQTLHVRIGASIRDVTLPSNTDPQSAARILAKSRPVFFSEIYSFTRRRGARSDASKNLLAGQCPSCGAVPEKFGATNRCPSCAAVYNSGEYDWVLSEITQASEWNSRSVPDVPGLEELSARSRSMNRGVIEDRASALFWRWIEAQAIGAAPLRRDATKAMMESAAGYEKKPVLRAAVGAADLRSVTVKDGIVCARVRIAWSAAPSSGGAPQHRDTVLSLILPLSEESGNGFADQGCSRCGGPMGELDAETCAYCGEALQAANGDWLLDGVE